MVSVAQLVERQTVALDVAGSNPVAHPNLYFLSPARPRDKKTRKASNWIFKKLLSHVRRLGIRKAAAGVRLRNSYQRGPGAW